MWVGGKYYYGSKKTALNTKDSVDSARDRVYWRALLNAALNFRIPQAMELDIV